MINVTVEEHERYGTKVYDMTIEQGENKIALSFPDWSSANHINTYICDAMGDVVIDDMGDFMVYHNGKVNDEQEYLSDEDMDTMHSTVENSQQIVIAEARERIQDGKKN